jgi:hypothetical protein
MIYLMDFLRGIDGAIVFAPSRKTSSSRLSSRWSLALRPRSAPNIFCNLSNCLNDTSDPGLPTLAVQQVGGYPRYTGGAANVAAKAADDPERKSEAYAAAGRSSRR